jgi:hypothetical protein
MMTLEGKHSVVREPYRLNIGFQDQYFGVLKTIGNAVFEKDNLSSENIFVTCQSCQSCQGKEDKNLCKSCVDAFTSGAHQV